MPLSSPVLGLRFARPNLRPFACAVHCRLGQAAAQTQHSTAKTQNNRARNKCRVGSSPRSTQPTSGPWETGPRRERARAGTGNGPRRLAPCASNGRASLPLHEAVGGFAPNPQETKRQRFKRLERPPDPKPIAVAPVDGGVPVAVRGAEVPRIVDPGAAAKDPATAISGCPGGAIRRRAAVISIPAVLHPLPHVAMHVVEAKGVGLERAHLDRLLPVDTLGASAIRVVALKLA